MKKILFFVLTMILTAGFFTVSNAVSAVTERPDIQVIIDCEKSAYTNSPIIVNGRTLLPLRELLTNLGVANDDQHIIWNGKENSVTAIKGTTQLYLKVGDTNAKVNDKTSTLDAAPVNYKGSVYIPARFAAEAFDKVVVWDKIAKRIYMRDTTQYNEVKSLLGKSNAVMNGLARYQESYELDSYEVTESGEEYYYSNSMAGYTDNANKTVHWLVDYYDFTVDYYVFDQKSYMKDSIENVWEKEDMPEKDFQEKFSDFVDMEDVIFASLAIDKTSNLDEIHLEGNVSLAYFDNTDPTITVYYDEAYSEVVIDKATGHITQIHSIDKYITTPSDDEASTSVEDMIYSTSDYNGNFKITIPSEIQ